MTAEGRIGVNLCVSVDLSPTDFKGAHQSGLGKERNVKGGQGVMEPGTTQVEHLPLETYDFTFAGKSAKLSRQTGCRPFERGNF